MVKLRLRRMGKKKQPIYKVVAADARSPRDGKFLEAVGTYNPLTNPHSIDLKEDRVMYWLNVGAQPTLTVKSILSQQGILLKRDLTKRGLSEDKVAARLEEWTKLKEAKGFKKTTKKEVKKETVAEVKEEAVAEAKEKVVAEVKEEAVAEVKEEIQETKSEESNAAPDSEVAENKE